MFAAAVLFRMGLDLVGSIAWKLGTVLSTKTSRMCNEMGFIILSLQRSSVRDHSIL